MRTIMSSEEMRRCDETAGRTYGIPSILLMENAGSAAARILREKFPAKDGTRVGIVCGKGNNGGDGLVMARHLANAGVAVTVILVSPPAQFKGDARRNYAILRKIARHAKDRIAIVRFSQQVLTGPRLSLLVDAVFGTGFQGRPKQPYSAAIEWMNQQRLPVLAVDVPSGVNGTTGMAAGEAVKATVTVTMGALKTGLLCNDGRELSGEVDVVDVGIPEVVFHDERLRTFLVEASDVTRVLPRRSQTAHKYSVGKVFVLAGSRGFTGAAALVAESALRSGAGAVVLGTPDAVYPILAKKLSEEIVMPLPGTEEGSLSMAGLKAIEERLHWADVAVLGPGLSRNEETQELVRTIMRTAKGCLLVDADGLNAIAGKSELLRGTQARVILTPHEGEFARLSHSEAESIRPRRIELAREFARKHKVTLILKGAPTITAVETGEAYVNSTGNPGMATVGSGDVLSGIIGGLWAQGMDAEHAAWAGAFLHGRAGDLTRDSVGEHGLVAHDLIDFLPQATRELL